MIEKFHKEADAVIREVVGQFNPLDLLNPRNYDSARQEFLDGKVKNPVFKYPKPSKEHFEKLTRKLNALKLGDDVVSGLLSARRDELLLGIELVSNIASKNFSQVAEHLYPMPTQDEVGRALRIIKRYNNRPRKAKKKVRFLTAAEAQTMVEEYLKNLGISDVKVVIQKSQNTRIAIEKVSKTVTISSQAKFGPTGFLGVLAHEIDVHAVRSLNGRLQPLALFEVGTAGTTGFEEGLAVLARKMVTENPYIVSPSYMLVAASLAKTKSFREVYEALRKLGASKESAFRYTFRVKRGTQDSAKPGVFPKDAQYLKGVFEIEVYLKEGGLLSSLFVGKINSKDVDIVASLPEIKPPKYFPAFFKDAESRVLELISSQNG